MEKDLKIIFGKRTVKGKEGNKKAEEVALFQDLQNPGEYVFVRKKERREFGYVQHRKIKVLRINKYKVFHRLMARYLLESRALERCA